ncbi:MAG: hypothetical protein KQH83_01995 [Actinobacteria bacterium]|nr:hypothetical protein [Actinomycetota bacterium]
MTAIRVVIGALLTLIVAVTLLPMLVLLDLVGGGNGWGLCPDGIASCHASYFAGPELAVALTLVLFLLLFLLRLALHAQRIVERRKERELYDTAPPPPPA